MTGPKRWQLFDQQSEITSQLGPRLDVHPILAQILLNREIKSLKEASAFLMPNRSVSELSFDQKDLDQVTGVLHAHVSRKTPIMVYGDYDVDGMSSTALMVTVLRQLGATVHFYIPDRFQDGYGLSQGIIPSLIEKKIGLLLTLDCGVSNRVEIAAIKDQCACDVLVLDHHQLPDILPDFDGMLNPKQLPESHSYAHLCTAGIVFECLDYYVRRYSCGLDMNAFLDLVALGTVADVARLKGANRWYVVEGLRLLSARHHLGIRCLLEEANCTQARITAREIGFVIAPRLNASGRLKNGLLGVKLLMAETEESGRHFARLLESLNQERRALDVSILKESVAFVEAEKLHEQSVIVMSSKTWHPGVIGITASKLVERYSRPVVLVCEQNEIARGSARSVGEVNVYQVLKSCQSYFQSFGGHQQAAGFSMSLNQIPGFIESLQLKGREQILPEALFPIIHVDAPLMGGQIDLALAESLQRLAPFGEGNPEPVFYFEGLTPVSPKCVGDGRHVKVMFTDPSSGVVLDGIGFNLSDKLELFHRKKVSVVGHLQVNEWQQRRSVQIQILDVK